MPVRVSFQSNTCIELDVIYSAPGRASLVIDLVVARFVVWVVVGLDDEGGADLGWVLSLALVLHIGMETGVVISGVRHLLEATVGELDGVAAGDGLAVAGLLLLEGGAVVRVLHPVGEAVRLGGGLVPLVVHVVAVRIDGGGLGGEGQEGEGGGAEEMHAVS